MLLINFKYATDRVILDHLGFEGLGHLQQLEDLGERVHGQPVEAIFGEDLMHGHLSLGFVFHVVEYNYYKGSGRGGDLNIGINGKSSTCDDIKINKSSRIFFFYKRIFKFNISTHPQL